MSFFILSIVILFIGTITPFVRLYLDDSTLLDQMEWENFIHQIKIEIRESSSIELKNNQLRLSHPDGLIQYEKFDTILRRRVDNKGHEVLLYHVKSAQFIVEDSYITIKVLHQNGKTYEKKIFMPNQIIFIDKK